MLIKRLITNNIEEVFSQFPVVIILGPRQVGKSTLVKSLVHYPGEHVYLDLELGSDDIKLSDPESYLASNKEKIIIIDEIQRKPELFPLLRALVDKLPGSKYVLLGSASEDIIMKSSESLAGRSIYFELEPFTIWESGENSLKKLWLRGGFPKSFLANTDAHSMSWLNEFVKSYIERELSVSYLKSSPILLEKFLMMMTTVHGQLVNYSTIAGSMDISTPTVKNILQFFEQKYILRTLQPYFTNIGKRLVKSPKLYFRDSGLLHVMRGISNEDELESDIIKGASWEGFVIQQIMAVISHDVKAFFYRTSDGAEMDLLLLKGSQIKLGFEIKYSNSPKLSPAVYHTKTALNIPKILVVTPSSDEFPINENIIITPLKNVLSHLIEHKLTTYKKLI